MQLSGHGLQGACLLGDPELRACGALAFECGKPSRDSSASRPGFTIRAAKFYGNDLLGFGGAFLQFETAILSAQLKLLDQILDSFDCFGLFGVTRRIDLAVEFFALGNQFLIA